MGGAGGEGRGGRGGGGAGGSGRGGRVGAGQVRAGRGSDATHAGRDATAGHATGSGTHLGVGGLGELAVPRVEEDLAEALLVVAVVELVDAPFGEGGGVRGAGGGRRRRRQRRRRGDGTGTHTSIAFSISTAQPRRCDPGFPRDRSTRFFISDFLVEHASSMQSTMGTRVPLFAWNSTTSTHCARFEMAPSPRLVCSTTDTTTPHARTRPSMWLVWSFSGLGW